MTVSLERQDVSGNPVKEPAIVGNHHRATRKALQRLFHGQSFPTTVDETGRLVLPAKLRQKIDLDNEAFFIAAGDTFQIWKPETYEAEELARTEEWLDELPDDFDPLIFLDNAAKE